MKPFTRSMVLTFSFALAGFVALSALAAAEVAAQPSQQPATTLLAPPGSTVMCSPCYLAPVEAPRLRLTASQLQLLEEGEISTGQHVIGVLGAAYVGFGMGHLLEGRWGERGWIFTVGEPLALAMMIKGLESNATTVCESPDPDRPGSHDCHSEGHSERSKWMAIGGLVAFVGLRTWEIVDSYTGPVERNRKVRHLRALSGMNPQQVRLAPYLAPTADGAGGMAGVATRF